jgi:ribosomal protein S18 acetylase RimI-like enzyme
MKTFYSTATAIVSLQFLLAATNSFCVAWLPPEAYLFTRSHRSRLDLSSVSTDESYAIAPLVGDEPSIRKASEFFAKSYWLGTRHVQVASGPVTDAVYKDLLYRQFVDFSTKYGERMGNRLLDAGLIAAIDTATNEIVGLAGIEVCLLDAERRDILTPEVSEEAMKAALGNLGPKERRQYKNASPFQIADELLQPNLQAVCVLCNLVVSPTARGKGIAMKLCHYVKESARDAGFDGLLLKVEKDNEAACKLYLEKLNYQELFVCGDSSAVRFNLQDGTFERAEAETLILVKSVI